MGGGGSQGDFSHFHHHCAYRRLHPAARSAGHDLACSRRAARVDGRLRSVTLHGFNPPSVTGGLPAPVRRSAPAPTPSDHFSRLPAGTDNRWGREGAASARAGPWKRKLCHVTRTGQRG
ncbi:hypothetical protein GCM10010350_59360 [Streptomyces galilaeus]|nr:hypothetical protein GCM10010350_59360 [Streptomyces galilaeus]